MAESVIEVFAADIRDPQLKERCTRLYPQLLREEREKAGRFLREDDRLRFIAGRLMIRSLAAERLGPDEPEIRLTEYGKPYIAGADGFRFSLSHSGDYVVLAVSGTSVGVDIERQITIEWRDIAASFGAGEREMLERADDPLRCFYMIWTVREAFSKEEGIGLSLYEKSTPDIDYSQGIVRHNGRTLCFTTYDKDGYMMSVCGSFREVRIKPFV